MNIIKRYLQIGQGLAVENNNKKDVGLTQIWIPAQHVITVPLPLNWKVILIVPTWKSHCGDLMREVCDIPSTETGPLLKFNFRAVYFRIYDWYFV